MANPFNTSDWRTNRTKIVLAWVWFFLVLLSYYLLKPLRDGYVSGLASYLNVLFLGTFVGTLITLALYSSLVSIVSPKKLVMIGNQFFAANLLIFIAIFASPLADNKWAIAAFFIWTSIFNIFSVTMFWSIMTEQFSEVEGKTWFGIIAAGGSLGSVAGSAIALKLTEWFGTISVMCVSLLVIELTMIVAYMSLLQSQQRNSIAELTGISVETAPSKSVEDTSVGGTIYDGLVRVLTSPYLFGICLFAALGKFTATFTYNNLQGVLNVEMLDKVKRTILFSEINVYSQVGSLFVQALVVGFVMRRMGIITALMIPCVCVTAWFGWLGFEATLAVLVVGQVGQQILGYGFLVPAQHVLFTVVSREDKYKSKAFTDTVVVRGSDAISAQITTLLSRAGMELGKLAFFVLPVCIGWCLVAGWVGMLYRAKSKSELKPLATERNT